MEPGNTQLCVCCFLSVLLLPLTDLASSTRYAIQPPRGCPPGEQSKDCVGILGTRPQHEQATRHQQAKCESWTVNTHTMLRHDVIPCWGVRHGSALTVTARKGNTLFRKNVPSIMSTWDEFMPIAPTASKHGTVSKHGKL